MTKETLVAHLLLALVILIPVESFAQWSPGHGLENLSISAVVASHKNLIAGDWRGFLYLSTDSGGTWTLRDTVAKMWVCPNCGLVTPPIITLFANDSEVFAGAGNIDSGSVHISTDNGITWIEKDSAFAQSINCFEMEDGIIFAGTNHGVFHSTDNGLSWSASNAGLSFQVMRLATIGTNLFAGTTGNGVFLSTDKGTSWNAVNTGLTNNSIKSIYGLTSHGTNLFAGVFSDSRADSLGGVFVSTNSGTSWSSASSGLTNHMINVLHANDTNLFAGTNIGVFLSTNDGITWKDVSTGTQVDSSGIISLAVRDPFLFAGTNSNGLWRRSLSQINTFVTSDISRLPSQFSLEQNYPNPFNPTTTITYQVPTNGIVRLEVFDMLGRKIRTLVDESQHAGVYSVIFNAINLPSGAYFYRITTNSFVQTKKLLVIE